MPALNPERMSVLFHAQPAPVLARVAVALAVTLIEWDMRKRTRKALLQLEDWQLKDIGLERGVAYTEARRPFWRV